MKLTLTFGPGGMIKIDLYDKDRNVMSGDVLLDQVCPEMTKLTMKDSWATLEFKEDKGKE